MQINQNQTRGLDRIYGIKRGRARRTGTACQAARPPRPGRTPVLCSRALGDASSLPGPQRLPSHLCGLAPADPLHGPSGTCQPKSVPRRDSVTSPSLWKSGF